MENYFKHVISVRPEEGLALWYDFLLNEIMLSRSQSDIPFYLISPYINDFALDLTGRRGIPELGIDPGRFALLSFCHAYVRTGGHLKIMAHFPEKREQRGKTLRDTLEFLQCLYSHPSGRVEIRLHKRVHGKIYIGLGAVLSGSPNATSGGLHYNTENLYYFADDKQIESHRRKADRLWSDTGMQTSWEEAWRIWMEES